MNPEQRKPGDSRRVALLLSRQPLRPSARCGWVKQVAQALDWIAANGYAVVSSVGLTTWELVTALAAQKSIPLTIVIASTSEAEFHETVQRVGVDFALEQDSVDWEWADVGEEVGSQAAMVSRDKRVIELANLLLPISLRPGSTLGSRMTDAIKLGQVVDHRFEGNFQSRSESLVVTIDRTKLNPELLSIGNKYIIHWTRATNAPWPGERRIDFYGDIGQSNEWVRSGLATLRRIVSGRRLIGSPLHMPGKIACVSLSSLPPDEVIELMKWRARYRQMSFEPYGVGLRRETAARLGIREVVYFDRDTTNPATNDPEPWRRQSKGKITDWRNEREYRCRGNLDFSQLQPEDLMLFCHTSSEAAKLGREFGLPVTSFEI